MKSIFIVLFFAGLLTAVPAEASLDLAKKSNCLACHQVDKKVVGPSFQDISRKYAGNKEAAKMLAAKVKSGGKDVWGPVAMPPSANVKDADIEALVKWVLAGAR